MSSHFVMSYQENPQVICFMVFIISLDWKSVWRGYLHVFPDYCVKSDNRGFTISLKIGLADICGADLNLNVLSFFETALFPRFVEKRHGNEKQPRALCAYFT
jgi:hypothetical protein